MKKKFETTITWDTLGDIDEGRPNLGAKASVAFYRLMQMTIKETLVHEYGNEKADDLIREAGRTAGKIFCSTFLDKNQGLGPFLAELQAKMEEMGIGLLRIEEADKQTLTFKVVVAEDLDCSGMPVLHTMMCTFDEGFLAGAFEEFTSNPMRAEEVECWASGGRVCRFDVSMEE